MTKEKEDIIYSFVNQLINNDVLTKDAKDELPLFDPQDTRSITLKLNDYGTHDHHSRSLSVGSRIISVRLI